MKESPLFNANPIDPPLPKEKDNRLRYGNLMGSSASLALCKLSEKSQSPLLIITSDVHTQQQIDREIRFFSGVKANRPLIFPDMETLPYDHFSPHEDLISDRLLTLYKLPMLTQGMIITAMPTLMQRLPPKQYLLSNTLVIECGDKINLGNFKENLVQSGYRQVEQVLEHGEFSSRGSILDLFPMGSHFPYRIELFDNEVESIRSFDPENQLSIKKINSIRLLPAREFPLTQEGIKQFRQAWRAKFTGNPMESPIYQKISQGEAASGVEYYLPLFFDHTETLFDYLPNNTQLIFINHSRDMADQFWHEIKERYEQLRFDITKPLCEPNEIFMAPDNLFGTMKSFCQIQLSEDLIENKPGHFNFDTKMLPSLKINHKAKEPLEDLKNFISSHSSKILFCAESTGRREILMDLLKSISLYPKLYPSWQAFIEDDQPLGITVATLEKGLHLSNPDIALITESQLLGEQVMQRRLRKHRELDPESLIRNLTELNIGAPVVHIDHGIGRYLGLETIKTDNIEAEYLTLEYAGGDKIYVPISSLNSIARYSGRDADHAPLTRLGSKQWEKNKEKAAKQVRDTAAELLEIYSKRQAAQGFAFQKPTKEFQAFRSAFPFEETPDQRRAINEVIEDMISPRSMDRLICGDVGFGKTEVAMQAAFLAVQSEKQVAILAPTTLLASQHLHNFQDRFSDYPIKIASLSRLRTKKETDDIIQELRDGKIDIIIGTHKLLQKNIQFKDLGLLIVDEEQRFGVHQKERIKAMRAHVDILTLTATPIPRTLNMALAGTRDLSLIATPPAKRLSIKTFVNESNPSLIREAILRESMRGGQVYFLHNKVATISGTAEKLSQIIPEAKIAIAHGQMREKELENVMSDFYHQKFNVLVCTTIIESGIDIPSTNTIIINRADQFGLAQLHQLRGRVGRSHHQAYAYLLTPPTNALTKDAQKRLEAISQLEDLGAGFQLATHDLEIRGAGELLGEEQSGHIEAIGFSLYMELLNEAVKSLKSGKEPDFEKPLDHGCEIDLKLSALIPNHYIPDVHTRLNLYKRLANAENQDHINDIKIEMIDRFGLFPDATQNLFDITALKIRGHQLGLQKIEASSTFAYFQFNEKPNINPDCIIKLIQTQSKIYRLQSNHCLRMELSENEDKSRIKAISDLLNHFEKYKISK